MKITKIPGFGDAGIIVEGVDFSAMTDAEWFDWGRTHLDKLVIIFKDTNCSHDRYAQLNHIWGSPYPNNVYNLYKKYGLTHESKVKLFDVVDEEDKKYLVHSVDIQERPGVHRVTGQLNEHGRPSGVFATGELLWHSNEAGQIVRNPTVMLLSVENVLGSSTGFASTHLWYERQSNAFRSELDEMICEHDFVPGRISPTVREEMDDAVRRNMSSGYELMPMVEASPGGIRGLHISNTVVGIKGMPRDEANALVDRIKSELFTDSEIYDHWWQKPGEIAIFDNSITQHRRLGDPAKRLLLRHTCSLSNILDYTWCPYELPEFRQRYWDRLVDMATVLGKPLPKPMK